MSKKMKKIISVLTALIIIILFVPFPAGAYKDGGTRMYTALTYKIVKWHCFVNDTQDTPDFSQYVKTSVFLFPDNFKSYEELWEKEKAEKWDPDKLEHF